ncbi:MAG: hypothetical protein ACOX2L_06390 [Anaerolineae bacterium]|jgi:hypothetical protein
MAFLRILAILLIPIVWGLASARLIEWLRERRKARSNKECQP